MKWLPVHTVFRAILYLPFLFYVCMCDGNEPVIHEGVTGVRANIPISNSDSQTTIETRNAIYRPKIESSNEIFLLNGRSGDGAFFRLDDPKWQSARECRDINPTFSVKLWSDILEANPNAECAYLNRLYSAVLAEDYSTAYKDYLWIKENASNILTTSEMLGESAINKMMIDLGKAEDYFWDIISIIAWYEKACPNDYRLFCIYGQFGRFMMDWQGCPLRYNELAYIILSSSLSRVEEYEGLHSEAYMRRIVEALKQIK